MKNNQIILDDYYTEQSESEKVVNWSQWSGKYGEFPTDFDELITYANTQENLDLYNSYGFKIAYFMYFEGWDYETAKEYFTIDYFGYHVLYNTEK